MRFGDGVQPADTPGQYTVLGWSEDDARTALADALGKASQYASRNGCKSRPLRVDPGDGKDPLGRAVFTARVTFTLEIDPNQAGSVSANSARANAVFPTALDQRLRRMVEDGRLSLEAYEQLVLQQRNAGTVPVDPPRD